MEKLLNKLIEKGWKPFGREPKKHWWIYCMETDMYEFWIKFYVDDLNWIWEFFSYETSIRNVVSKESGLWQFVCENGMIWRWDRITKRKKVKDTDSRSWEEVIYYSVIWSYNETDYQYRLIETALLDEKDIEQFLLDNIKIDE